MSDTREFRGAKGFDRGGGSVFVCGCHFDQLALFEGILRSFLPSRGVGEEVKG